MDHPATQIHRDPEVHDLLAEAAAKLGLKAHPVGGRRLPTCMIFYSPEKPFVLLPMWQWGQRNSTTIFMDLPSWCALCCVWSVARLNGLTQWTEWRYLVLWTLRFTGALMADSTSLILLEFSHHCHPNPTVA